MLKKMFITSAFVVVSGIFCIAYSQEKEAVIKLDSPEEIEAFQKIFGPESSQPAPGVKSDLEKALADNPKEPPKKIEAAQEEFKVYKPEAKEVPEEKTAPELKDNRLSAENGFKVFIPEAKEDTGTVKESGRSIKWLESSEDLEEFEEILKKGQIQ